MTIVPRRLVQFLARRRLRALQRRLHAQGDGTGGQARAFRNLLGRLAGTAFGRQHALDARMSYAEFRAAVPLRPTAAFTPFSERMAAGEPDVLWPGRCRTFVYTAGTVDGTPHMLPATTELEAHFRQTLGDAVLLHAVRSGRLDTCHALNLLTGPSMALSRARGARAGFLEGIASASLPDWTRANLLAPDPELAALPEGADKARRIAERYASADVRLLAGSPSSLLAALQAARATRPDGALPWNSLAVCVHSGALPGILAPALEKAAGPGVTLHETYPTAQGVFAAQDGEAAGDLRLFTDAGLFFEFLPVEEHGDLDRLGGRCVPLGETQAGRDYQLVVTTPAGLCRCLVGDLVRFTSVRPPRLVVTGRAEFLLRSFNERVNERELNDALRAVCAANQWETVGFHVAPYFTRTVPRPGGCHEWWIELKPGTVRTPTGPVLGEELDAELTRRNRTYGTQRTSGALETPLVRLVMPGVFARWSELHPTHGGPGKFARCRNDRLIADQLAGIARFHANTRPPPYPSAHR